MGYEEVQRDLKQGTFPPICLLYGPEDYLKRKALKAIVEGLLKPGEREWGSIPMEGRGALAQSITAALATVPFGARYGVVTVLGIEDMDDGEQEALALSLPKLPPGYLVLTAVKLDRGRKLYRAVVKSGKVYAFDHLTGPGLKRWLETRAAQLGLKLPPASVRELAAMEDLGYLDTELEKMALYNPGGALSQEEFDQLFFPSQGEDDKRIFALVDAVGMKNTAQALKHLDVLYSLGYDYFRIFGMLARQIRLLVMAVEAQGRPDLLVREHKLNAFVAKKACQQSANFSPMELRQAMAFLLKIDQSVKTGIPSRFALEVLVVGLTK